MLWRKFHWDGDVKLIYRGLYLDSLVIAHDGSYMSKVITEVCSCAFVIHCRLINRYTYCTWVEESIALKPDNYCAESLGGISAQLVIKAKLTGRAKPQTMSHVFCCDNLGVVHHGNQPKCPLPEKQSQTDVLQVFK